MRFAHPPAGAGPALRQLTGQVLRAATTTATTTMAMASGAEARDHLHSSQSGLIVRGFRRHYHFGLAGGAAAALPGLGSPEVSVVHLNQAGEFIMSIPVGQGFANLVAHGPHGFVGLDLQHSLHRQHGDAAFLASHQPYQPKPYG